MICPNYLDAQAGLPSATVARFMPEADRLVVLADEPHLLVIYPSGRQVIPAQAGELTAIPLSLLDALTEVDEIWVPTTFLHSRLLLATGVPVLHMPLGWQHSPLAANEALDFMLPTFWSATRAAPIACAGYQSVSRIHSRLCGADASWLRPQAAGRRWRGN